MLIPNSAVLFFTETVFAGLGLGLEGAGLGLDLCLETTGLGLGLGLGTLVLTTRLNNTLAYSNIAGRHSSPNVTKQHSSFKYLPHLKFFHCYTNLQ